MMIDRTTLLLAVTFLVASSAARADVASSNSANGSKSAELVTKGDDQIAADQLADAIASYKSAIDADSKNSVAHQRLGHAYSISGKLDLGLQEERTAIELDQNNAEAHANLGWIFGMQQHFRAAVEEEKIAIALDPNTSSAYSILGLSLASLGDYDLAVSAFNKALALTPDDFNTYMNLAAAYGRKKEYKSAATMYKRAVELNQSSPNAYLGLGAALGKTGDMAGQVKAYEQAVALAPNNPENHGRLGFALSQMGDWRAAMREGSVANGLRIRRSSSDFMKMFLTTWAAIFVVFGLLFAVVFSGSRFKPQSGEMLIRSFFLTFYKDKPGRFVLTNRRIVFVPEAFSTWFGSTRVSIELDQISEIESNSSMSGGRLSILSNNGSVNQFSMPNLVLEPLTKQLKAVAAEQEAVKEKKDVSNIADDSESGAPTILARPADFDPDVPYDPFADEVTDKHEESVIVEVLPHQSES